MQAKTQNKISVENEFELCDGIKSVCNKEGKQFIYSYFPDPDATMHDYGVSSDWAHKVLEDISEAVKNLHTTTTNTLFVISADHGQIDVEGTIELYKDKEIMDMLEIYPYLEARAVCFKVKPDKKELFKETFTKKYGEDFVLFESQDLINKEHNLWKWKFFVFVRRRENDRLL